MELQVFDEVKLNKELELYAKNGLHKNCDGVIIEIEKNCYVNIQSEALTRDVLELFGEENLIILK